MPGMGIMKLIVAGVLAFTAKAGPAPAISNDQLACTAESRLQLVSDACCKHCKKGKACGDSCISRSKTCTQAPGCACD